jgi:hypothetical protein
MVRLWPEKRAMAGCQEIEGLSQALIRSLVESMPIQARGWLSPIA